MTETEENVELLKKENQSLKDELRVVENQLATAEKKVEKLERQCESSRIYSEELRSQVEKLGSELHEKRNASFKDAEVQVNFINDVGQKDVTESIDTKQQTVSSENSNNEAAVNGAIGNSIATEDTETAALATAVTNDNIETKPADSSAGLPDWGADSQSNELQAESVSIADSLKQAAEEAMQQSGYVYDANSGLYYDYKSGYYYDPVKSLFYEPNSGVYYSFDQETQTYNFHSQVDLSKYQQHQYDVTATSQSDAQSQMIDNWEVGLSRRQAKRKALVDEEKINKHPKASKLMKTDGKEESEIKTSKEDSNNDDNVRKEKKHDRKKEKKKKAKDSRSRSRSRSHSKKHSKHKKHKKHKKKSKHKHKDIDDEEKEEGELCDEDDGQIEGEMIQDEYQEDVEDQFQEEEGAMSPLFYPPCVRVMVTASPHLPVGTLYVVTVTGATIGREKELGHTVTVPDVQVSKMHCDIQYSEEDRGYVLRDHASQNGTFLNGQRLAEPKTMSERFPLKHLDVVAVGSTTLTLHIHPGTATCDRCEPGIVQAAMATDAASSTAEMAHKEEAPVLSKAAKEKIRRQQLKGIKKKYGLEGAGFERHSGAVVAAGYTDKAEERRQTVGSDNPHQPDAAPASVHRAISAENKGHKLLAKMGWKEGDSLGREGGEAGGITEPISVTLRSSASAGLGSSRSHDLSLDQSNTSHKARNLAKTRDRFHAIISQEASGPNSSQEMGKATSTASKVGGGGGWVRGGTHTPASGALRGGDVRPPPKISIKIDSQHTVTPSHLTASMEESAGYMCSNESRGLGYTSTVEEGKEGDSVKMAGGDWIKAGSEDRVKSNTGQSDAMDIFSDNG